MELLKKSLETKSHDVNELMHIAKTELGVNIFPEHKTRKKLRKKDLLYLEGDSPNYLYHIISGKIKVFKSNEIGKEFITDIFKEGDFLGYLALLEESEHKEFAMAIEDSEIELIPKEDFFELLHSNHSVALQFINLLSRSVSEAEEKLIQLAYNSARKRVAEAIIFVSNKYQKEGENELSFALLRENISALSGISPESVSRNLSDFRDMGIIETNNGMLKIIDFNKLQRLKN